MTDGIETLVILLICFILIGLGVFIGNHSIKQKTIQFNIERAVHYADEAQKLSEQTDSVMTREQVIEVIVKKARLSSKEDE